MIKRKKPLILFKYGGNAMTDDELKKQVLEHMCSLTKKGYHVVIVHGGGPFIKDILGKVGVESEFIDGHRKTTPEALKYVEMALKGEVNGSLVSLVNRSGYKAVGLSGKDGKMAIATKRLHRKMVDGKWKSFDLGQVGDVKHINPQLPERLLNEGYIPVVTCIASDEEGNDYNINADMFAGHLAGALHAEQYIVLTDVDGLRMDKDKPETLIDKLQAEVKLPPGYYFSYGGQFENLQSAKKSSSIAVPVALVLIFILLYFAFSSLKQATLIFTAIPLAIMGGVWTLFLRGMPFSISAGVGFIALFGIVVLNGIVLISYYNQLEQEGVTDIYERVLKGTSMRLRPVLLTASTDALGFLPMAVSTAAGAEVQRPLATVVIGGLITSTFLTLVILPVIYYLFHSGEWKKLLKRKKKPVVTVVLLLLLFPVGKSWAQEPARTVTLDQAVEMALNNNLSVKAQSMMVKRAQAMKKSSFSLDPVMLQYDKGKINTNYNDYNFQVRQRFEFPTMYGANARLANENIRQSELALGREKSMLTTQVKMLYSRSQIAGEKLRLLRRRDSLFGALEKAADRQLKSGAIGLSEYNLLKAEALRYRQELLAAETNFETQLGQLQVLLYSEERISPVTAELEHFQPVGLLPDTASTSWEYRMMLQNVSLKNAEVKVAGNNWAPAFSVGYFDQSFDGNKGYDGWSVGLEIPIWFWSQTSKTKALKLERESLTYQAAQQQQQDWALQKQLIMQLQQLSKSVNMYESEIIPRARELLKAAVKSRELGQTDYIGFSKMAGEAFLSHFNYLDILQQYNETVLQLNLVMGSPETK